MGLKKLDMFDFLPAVTIIWKPSFGRFVGEGICEIKEAARGRDKVSSLSGSHKWHLMDVFHLTSI